VTVSTFDAAVFPSNEPDKDIGSHEAAVAVEAEFQVAMPCSAAVSPSGVAGNSSKKSTTVLPAAMRVIVQPIASAKELTRLALMASRTVGVMEDGSADTLNDDASDGIV